MMRSFSEHATDIWEAATMGATLNNWIENIVSRLPSLPIVAIIIIVTWIIARRTQRLVQRLAARTQAPPGIVELLGRLARFGIIALGALLVLDQLGWSQAALSFLAGLGIMGIAIGFALQDIVKQFLAGVLLLMIRPFNIGDRVRIGLFEGQVIQVQLRATVLKTANGDEVLIPNADVYTTAIVNVSRYKMRRQSIPLYLPSGIAPRQAHAAISYAISTLPGVADDPAPAIVATGFQGKIIKFEVRFWIDESSNSADAVKTTVIAAIQKALEPLGVDNEQGSSGAAEPGSS
jgi:small conductance mechanosensitive channel